MEQETKPASEDRQVEAIIESCMNEGDKTEKECRDMAHAVVNSKKEDE